MAYFRGKTFTQEDVVQAIERFDRTPRNAFAPLKKYSVKHNGKEYPPKDLLRLIGGQIQAYMGWVKANLAGSRRVRGIIVAHEFSERAKLAATVVPDLILKKYRVIFSFTDA